MVVCRPVRSVLELAPHIRVKDRPPPSPAVLRPPGRPLPSPTRICLRLWGLSSFLMTAVLEIQGRGRTAFCRPVSSQALGSPPTRPYEGPGRLRTLNVPFIPPNERSSATRFPQSAKSYAETLSALSSPKFKWRATVNLLPAVLGLQSQTT